MRISHFIAVASLAAPLVLMGASCGGGGTQCVDAEGRVVACPDQDSGPIDIRHDAGPPPDAGTADAGRNAAYEGACDVADDRVCRFGCLATPDGWPGAAQGDGYCTKPCANHDECGDPSLYRCAEVEALQYKCLRDADAVAPTARWVGANASRILANSDLDLAIEVHDDRHIGAVTVLVGGTELVTTANDPLRDDDGVTQVFSFLVPMAGAEVTVSASAADGRGQTASLEKTIQVDSTPPTVSIVRSTFLRPAGCVPSPSSVAVEASDDRRLAQVRILVDDIVVATMTPDNLSAMVDYNARNISSGIHTLSAVAEDEAGNTAEDHFDLRFQPGGGCG